MKPIFEQSFIPSEIQLEILGFDRIGFVEEITRFVVDYGHIVSVNFKADGVRSQGILKIHLTDSHKLTLLLIQLKTVSGLVSVKQLGEVIG